MFLQKFILDDEDWKSFTEILFEKMNQINSIFYIKGMGLFGGTLKTSL